MKKLLTLISVFAISSTSATSVISCVPQQAPINLDNTAGLSIDKRNAKDTSVDKETHHGVSNFYTLGDSLSDNGGLAAVAYDELGVKVKITGLYDNGFSNGLRVAELINKKLGFDKDEVDTFKSSNLIHDADLNLNNDKVWGRNYSIGGATAYESSDLTAKLLMGNTGIYKQAQALVKQQVIKDDDLFLIEIGGNDLFALAGARNNFNQQSSIMKNAIENISNCLYTLLNNGAKKILFIKPPDINLTPGYNNKNNDDFEQFSEADLSKIDKLCKEFDSNITKVINKVNEQFNDVVKTYNLYTELKNILAGFKETIGEGANVESNFAKSTAFDLAKLDLSNLEINATVAEKFKEAYEKDKTIIDKFFFIDKVHPTSSGHKYVSEIVWKLLISSGLIKE
ncbi:lipolytic enzyme, GDSL family [Spiroplasma litorale]|uniref:Lipolytic enzyme, GDSL family n=1 Tax=Spiroplasma litorale TaxID=216942 RepID=A0A0K1W1W8_9MOLU|nr:SGNH/GDSL hydrolase family protein [Spiroplasma litorale]AKX34181.1 lipolytic enzyme, GDSL family [Spiroplasma litorale]